MNAQGQAADYAATLLCEQLERLEKPVRILRCEESKPSSNQAHLLRLDSASKAAIALMNQLGNHDGHATFRWCQQPTDPRGKPLSQIFDRM